MSGIETFLMAASTALGAVSSIAQSSQQQKAQRQAQAIQMQQAQDQMAALEEQRTKAERDRRDRLARSMASQRAAFAGSGVSGDGSGDAVFDNLLAQSERERDDINSQIDRQIRSLQSGIQLNLLSRSSGPDPFGTLASFAKAGAGLIESGNQLKKIITKP
ncbi:MAG: hypothetical protein ACK4FK_04695 [Ferrovibrio sp.]|jgi:membrane-bound ClpP family serine protease|uniref:virion core protein, T7 gp14 family n=1 Tax=Ferrovibrio sp. TaxID=1917215 RepID=UPI00391961E0